LDIIKLKKEKFEKTIFKKKCIYLVKVIFDKTSLVITCIKPSFVISFWKILSTIFKPSFYLACVYTLTNLHG